MTSARKLAKSLLFHARGAQIRALAAPRRIAWLRRRLHLPANRPYVPLAHETPAGVHLQQLSAATSFSRPVPAVTPPQPDAVAFFAQRAVEHNPARYVAALTGGVAWGHPTGGVFTAAGQFVPAFTHDPSGGDRHTVWTRLRLPRPRRISGRALYLVTPEATDNFHHWMIDLLPRFGLVKAAGHRPADFDHVIINHAHRRYQLASLAQLGLAPERIVVADESLLVQADELVIPSLKPVNQALPAEDVAFLRRTFLAASTGTAPSRRLFLTRNDAGYRKLANEAALHPLLAAHGFEIVAPAQFALSEQTRLFAEAEVVAGAAGAAFANLVFASRGARVVEIAPPGWLAAFHWMVSARAGLEHHIVLGEGAVMRGVPDVSARERDIVVNPSLLASVLERVAPASATSLLR